MTLELALEEQVFRRGGGRDSLGKRTAWGMQAVDGNGFQTLPTVVLSLLTSVLCPLLRRHQNVL